MAKIAYLCNGMSSTLNSGLELARRLRADGHDVCFLSPVDVRAQVERLGFEFRHLTADRDFADSWAQAADRKTRRLIRTASTANDEIERTVEELGAELLLIDIEFNYAVLATAGLGKPTLFPIVWFSISRADGVPPLHKDMPPASGVLDHLRTELAWARLLVGSWLVQAKKKITRRTNSALAKPVEYLTRDLSDLRALAKRRGIRLGDIAVRTEWLRPVMYRHADVMCFNVADMDYPNAGNDRNHYVGPMVLRDRPNDQMNEAEQRKWEAFKQNSEQDPARPLVYCSLGTVWSADEAFLERVVDVFRRRQDWDLVLSLGGKLDPSRLEPSPGNVLVLSWAPQTEVLELADCALTHGGITSINESITLGVPLVVYSTKHIDQDGTAARVRYRGLGLAADKDTDTSADLERNIASVLDDAEYRRRVDAMSSIMADYETERRAEQLVRDTLEPGPSGAT